LFRFFQYRSETPKQIETNRKKCFLVLRNKPKNNRNSLSFSLFRFELKKKFDCFEDTLVQPNCKQFPGVPASPKCNPPAAGLNTGDHMETALSYVVSGPTPPDAHHLCNLLCRRESNPVVSSSPVKTIFVPCLFGVLQTMWKLEIFSSAPGQL
jgi:hypothetical protein